MEQNEIKLVKNMIRSLDALGYLGEFANLLVIITVLAGIISAGAITIPAVLLLLFNYWLFYFFHQQNTAAETFFLGMMLF